jgi:hypothetical protein
MNILQHLPESKYGPVLVTLNPPFPVDPAKTIGSWTYHHPSMTTESVSSQSLLPSIQNRRRISYAGAWTKYGFHEDGFSSGMRLVSAPPFNVKPPFPILPPHRAIPRSGPVGEVAKVVVALMQVMILNPVIQGLWGLWAGAVVLCLDTAVNLLGGVDGEWGKEVKRVRGCWVEEEQGKGKVKKA